MPSRRARRVDKAPAPRGLAQVGSAAKKGGVQHSASPTLVHTRIAKRPGKTPRGGDFDAGPRHPRAAPRRLWTSLVHVPRLDAGLGLRKLELVASSTSRSMECGPATTSASPRISLRRA